MGSKWQDQIQELFLDNYQEWCLLSYSYLKDMSAAEDVVQDVMVKVLTLSGNKEISYLKGYIKSMVRNSSITISRRRFKLVPLKLSEAEEQNLNFQGETREMDRDRENEIMNSLDTLSENRRRVVELCVVDGLNYETAADELGLSVNTVKYHIKKAYKSLRHTLKKVPLLSLF